MDTPRAVSRDAVGPAVFGRAGACLGTAAYVTGVLALPATLLGTQLTVSTDAAVLVAPALGLLAGLVAIPAARRLEPVRHPRVAARLLGISVLIAVAGVLGSFVASGPIFGVGVLASALALVGLLVLRSGVATHHAYRVARDAAPLADLPEVDGQLPVRRQRLANGVVGVVLLAYAVGAVWEGGGISYLGVPTWATFGAMGVSFLLFALASGRRLSATGPGLLVETTLSARLYEWDEFAGYYCGERLVLLRRKPWLEDVVFDRDAVSADAFAVLDEALPEREHRAVPAGDAERRSDRAAGEP